MSMEPPHCPATALLQTNACNVLQKPQCPPGLPTCDAMKVDVNRKQRFQLPSYGGAGGGAKRRGLLSPAELLRTTHLRLIPPFRIKKPSDWTRHQREEHVKTDGQLDDRQEQPTFRAAAAGIVRICPGCSNTIAWPAPKFCSNCGQNLRPQPRDGGRGANSLPPPW